MFLSVGGNVLGCSFGNISVLSPSCMVFGLVHTVMCVKFGYALGHRISSHSYSFLYFVGVFRVIFSHDGGDTLWQRAEPQIFMMWSRFNDQRCGSISSAAVNSGQSHCGLPGSLLT